MNKQNNKMGMVLKNVAEKAIKNTNSKASLYYCYQPKQPKGLEKFTK